MLGCAIVRFCGDTASALLESEVDSVSQHVDLQRFSHSWRLRLSYYVIDLCFDCFVLSQWWKFSRTAPLLAGGSISQNDRYSSQQTCYRHGIGCTGTRLSVFFLLCMRRVCISPVFTRTFEYILTHKHQTHQHATSGWRIHCGVQLQNWVTINNTLSFTSQFCEARETLSLALRKRATPLTLYDLDLEWLLLYFVQETAFWRFLSPLSFRADVGDSLLQARTRVNYTMHDIAKKIGKSFVPWGTRPSSQYAYSVIGIIMAVETASAYARSSAFGGFVELPTHEHIELACAVRGLVSAHLDTRCVDVCVQRYVRRYIMSIWCGLWLMSDLFETRLYSWMRDGK